MLEVDSVDVLQLFPSFPLLVTESCVVTVVGPLVFFGAFPVFYVVINRVNIIFPFGYVTAQNIPSRC